MIYSDYEFLGILDIPHISTMFNVDSSLFKKMEVKVTDRSIEIKTDNNKRTIYLKQINIVDRSLSNAIINKIASVTRNSSYTTIDYKTESFIGYGEVQCSMVLTGKKTEISSFKYFLKSVLGIKVDPLIGSMKPEETRLLLLLGMDINKVDVLLPIFDNDMVLLKKTFLSLKSKDLIDEYSSLTHSGHEVVAKIKGEENKEKQLGADTNSNFSHIAKYWDTYNTHNIAGTNKVVWEYDNSSMSGNIVTEDIHKYIHFDEITSCEINLYNKSYLYLSIKNRDTSKIFITSTDFSSILAIYRILDENTADSTRLLLSIYIGLIEKRKIKNYLNLSEARINYCYQILLEEKRLDENCIELTDEGLKNIKEKLQDDIYNMLNFEPSEISFNHFKRYEQLKSQNAKRRIIKALQRKHQNENTGDLES